jgi:hypothetical protein
MFAPTYDANLSREAVNRSVLLGTLECTLANKTYPASLCHALACRCISVEHSQAAPSNFFLSNNPYVTAIVAIKPAFSNIPATTVTLAASSQHLARNL